MTTWTDYTVPTITVEGGGPVRGLSLDDMTALMTSNLDLMIQATDLYIQMNKDILAKGNQVDLITMLARSFPGLVSEVIPIVTDSPELASKRLPAGLQMRVLHAAFKLTVEDVGGLGNLSAMLQTAVRAVAQASNGEVSQKLQAILSPSSIGGAGKTATG